jgi:hypothetical protein
MKCIAKLLTLLILIILTLNSIQVSGQAYPLKKDYPIKKDTAVKTHSVAKAAIFSAVLPGLGQGYNKKYWKIPIIYAGFGVIGYFVYTNNKEYKDFREAYLYVANDETYPIDNPYVTKYSETQLKDAMDYYRRNRDLSIIIGGLWYTLNILEAYVDAHFFDYDISDDLTMSIKPTMMNQPALSMQPPAPGLKVSFKF